MEDVITQRKGNYILVMGLENSTEVTIPKLGNESLLPGYYFYCGSAHGSGGIKSKVARYLNSNSKQFWHIDYLKIKGEC